MSCSIIFNQDVYHVSHAHLAAHAPARRLRSIMWPKSLWRCEQLQQVRPKRKPAGNIMRHVMASVASKSFDGKPISKQAWEIISVMYRKPIWTPWFLRFFKYVLWFYGSKWQFRKALHQWWSCPLKRHAGNRRHRHWNLRPQALKTAVASMCRNPWQTHICPSCLLNIPVMFSNGLPIKHIAIDFTSNIITMIITRVMVMIGHWSLTKRINFHIPSGSNFPIFSNQEGTISFFRWSIPPEMNQGCPNPRRDPSSVEETHHRFSFRSSSLVLTMFEYMTWWRLEVWNFYMRDARIRNLVWCI